MSLWSGIFTQNKNSLKSYTAICHSMINEMQNILFPVIVNANGTAITSDRAGSNDWVDIPNTRLSVILSYTKKWHDLNDEQKKKFQNDKSFKIGWVSSDIDNNFPHLVKSQGQLYASKGFELQKTSYK